MNYYLVKLRNGKVRYFSADTWEIINNRVIFYWIGFCLETFSSKEVEKVEIISKEEYEKGLERANKEKWED